MTTLKERVDLFNQLKLPGQMPMMHMGTSYLVNDLWREITVLRERLKPFADAVYNDNGDIEVTTVIDRESYIAAYFAMKRR